MLFFNHRIYDDGAMLLTDARLCCADCVGRVHRSLRKGGLSCHQRDVWIVASAFGKRIFILAV
jgi:hypothetical protein